MGTSSIETETEAESDGRRTRWWVVPAVFLFYFLVIIGATWPFATTFATRLPSTGDPLQHLWVMRWYKQCLMEGRSPLVCPELQYPVGAPLGNFSPLHLQSLIYLVVSSVVDNDVACFNTIWLSGLLLTGMGTFWLTRAVLRDDGAATLAGVLAMLSGPVMVHSHAHLELMYVGGFPIFFLAWMRFLDRPGLRRMLAAAAGFVLLGMCAAYFLVFAIFPAGLYFAWRASRQPKGEVVGWLRGRSGWLIGFVLVCLPLILLLFAGQIGNIIQGQPGFRPKAEFDRFGAPWWAYLVPVPGQLLQGFLPIDPYGATRTPGEGMAYLGVVALFLVAMAWFGRVRFRDAGFWWISTGLLVVLSLGSTVAYGPHRIPMPAGWLRDWEWFFPFRLIRVPARFKLFVPVGTAIIAGAAWMQLRRRWSRPIVRRLALGAVLLIAAADLAHVPYGSEPIPALPKAYGWIRERDPGAAWVDVPQMNSGNAHQLNSQYTYWQALHRGRTTAGYSGHQNRPFDDLMSWNSPFIDTRMMEASFPGPAGTERFDLIRSVSFRDYAWLYLTRHGLRFVVLHRREGEAQGYRVDRMVEALGDALCYDDGELAIFDRERMAAPGAPVAMGSEDWGGYYLLPKDGFVRLATRSSLIDVYNPDPTEPLVFAIEAKALGGPRRVTLTDGSADIWTWDILPEKFDLHVSPPFLLRGGRGQLRIESDGEVPLPRLHKLFEGEHRPASLVVRAVCLRPAEAEERRDVGVLAGRPRDDPSPGR